MTPKYNRALDLIACAHDAFCQGQYAQASKMMTRAFKEQDCSEAVSAMLQHNQRAVTAAGSDDGIDADFPGEELRLEPDEQDAREVQEAKAVRARRTQVSAAKARAQNYFATLKA